MSGGRPTDYGPDVLVKTAAYIENHEGLPNLAKLSRILGVTRTTIYKWREEHEEFSYICEELLAEQEDTLINNGLNGDFNPTITKLILTKHGYSDKVDSTHAGPEGKPIEYIERRIVRPAD